MKRLRNAVLEPSFLFLLVLPALLFPRALRDGTFFLRDLSFFAFPQRLKVGAVMRAGALPLWDATLHAGQPLLANPNNTALYPTAMLYAILPGVTALNVEILLHVALAGAGAYLLARSLALPQVAALVAGLVYALSGPVLSMTNLLNRHLAVAWTPFVVLFWQLFLSRRKPGWFACTAAALALQLLAGFPELSLAMAVLLALWTAAAPAKTPSGIARAGALALVLGAAGGLAAPQLLPAMRLLPGTVRGHGMDVTSILQWSVDPRRLPELAVPGLFGRVDAMTPSAYLGRAIEDRRFPYVLSLSFGAGALTLAALGLRGSGVLHARQALVLGGFAACAILLSLGRHLPGVVALVGVLPRIPLRYPAKLVCIAALPVALLSAAGLARILAGGGAARSFARAASALAGILGGVAALEAFVPAFGRWLAERLFRLDAGDVPAAGVASAFLLAALATAGTGFAAAAGFRGRPRAAAALACVAVAAPLVGQARGIAPVAPRLLFDEPASVALVRAAVGRGLLYRAPPTGTIRFEADSDHIAWVVRSDAERLAGYAAAGYGIPVAFHSDFDGLVRYDVARVRHFIESLPWDRRVAALAAAGVTAVLSDEPLAAQGLERAESPPGMHLYRVGGARPMAWLDSPDGAVEELPGGASERTFRVSAPRPATLLLATPYVEGWSARVDGKPATVRRANVYMQSVAVPAGALSLELHYRPPGLSMGLVLAALTTLVLAFVVARGRNVSTPPTP